MRSEMGIVRIGYVLLFVAFAIDFKRVTAPAGQPECKTKFGKIARCLNYAAEELNDSFSDVSIQSSTRGKYDIIQVPRIAYRVEIAERKLTSEDDVNIIQAYILARNKEDKAAVDTKNKQLASNQQVEWKSDDQRNKEIEQEFGKQVLAKVKAIEIVNQEQENQDPKYTVDISQFVGLPRNTGPGSLYALAGVVEIAAFALVKRNWPNAIGSNQNITHPYGVANNLIKAGICDSTLIAAAWLHDTVVETKKIKPQSQYNQAAPKFEKDEYEYTLTSETLKNVAGEKVAELVMTVTDQREKLILTAEAKAKYHQYSSLIIGIDAVILQMVDTLHNVQGWPMAKVLEYNNIIKHAFDSWFNPTLDLVNYLHPNDEKINTVKLEVVKNAHTAVSSKLYTLRDIILLLNRIMNGSFLVQDAIDIFYQNRHQENFIATALKHPILLDDKVVILLLDQEKSFPYLQEFLNLFRTKKFQGPNKLIEKTVDQILKEPTCSSELKDLIMKNKKIVIEILKLTEVVDILLNSTTIYTLTGKQMRNTLYLREAERVAKLKKILPEIRAALDDAKLLLQRQYNSLKNNIFTALNIDPIKSSLVALKNVLSSDGTESVLKGTGNAEYTPALKVIQGLKVPVDTLLHLLGNDPYTNILPSLEPFTASTDELRKMRTNIETIQKEIQLIFEIYYPYNYISQLIISDYDDIKFLEYIARLAPKHA